MRWNIFHFLSLAYLLVYKQYSKKRRYCSKEGFSYDYFFIALVKVE